MTPLRHLITEAIALGGENLCVNGHDWKSIGGRECSYQTEGCGGSQAVYECRLCGDVDYGNPGGPGYDDCIAYCRAEHEKK